MEESGAQNTSAIKRSSDGNKEPAVIETIITTISFTGNDFLSNFIKKGIATRKVIKNGYAAKFSCMARANKKNAPPSSLILFERTYL